MFKKIKLIINRWDPINLFSGAPDNEYERETEELLKYIKTNKNLTKEALANKIYEIFSKAFNNDIFKDTIKDCLLISEQIIKVI